MGTDSRKKGIHFIGSRELNIKRVARDRSCSVVMNLTCFNDLIEYVVNANAETSRFHSFKGLFQIGKFTTKGTHEI